MQSPPSQTALRLHLRMASADGRLSQDQVTACLWRGPGSVWLWPLARPAAEPRHCPESGWASGHLGLSLASEAGPDPSGLKGAPFASSSPENQCLRDHSLGGVAPQLSKFTRSLPAPPKPIFLGASPGQVSSKCTFLR